MQQPYTRLRDLFSRSLREALATKQPLTWREEIASAQTTGLAMTPDGMSREFDKARHCVMMLTS